MRIKVKGIDLAIYALFLAIFKIYIIPQTVQQIIKIVLLLCVLIFIFYHISLKNIFNVVIPFSFVIIISSILSYKAGYVGIQSVLNGTLHAICLYSIYMLGTYCFRHDYFEGMIKCLFNITSIYCILSLISMAILGHSTYGTEITYIFGYKFMTSYYFIFWTTLFRVRAQQKKDKKKRDEVLYFLLSFLTMFISKWLYCSTAFVASVLLIVFPLIPKKIKKVIMTPVFVDLTILGIGIIPFLIEQIMNIPYIQYIVTEILGETLTLTGRVKIFSSLGQIVNQRPFWGYGYGNDIVERVVGFGNAQNGFMQLMVDYGYIGVILFLFIIFICLRKKQFGKQLEGFYIVLYVLIICSAVEISYNYIFYMALFILGSYKAKKKDFNF